MILRNRTGFLSLGLLLGGALALADGTPTPTPTPPAGAPTGPGYNGGLGVANMPNPANVMIPQNQVTQLQGIMTSCGPVGGNTAVGAVGGALLQTFAPGAASGMISIGTACPMVNPPEESSPSCDKFKGPNGKFNPMALNAELASLGAVNSSLACRDGKINAIESEITCMRNNSQRLAQQFQAIGKYLNDNLTRMQNDVRNMDEEMGDRGQKLTTMKTRLYGGGQNDPAQVGLAGLAAQMSGPGTKDGASVMTTANNLSTQLTTAYQNLQASKKAYDDQIQSRTGALAKECFMNRTNASWRCERNGPPVTLPELIKCRYEQNATLTASGQINMDSNSQAKAQAAGVRMEALVTSILNDMPGSTSLKVTDSGIQPDPSAAQPDPNNPDSTQQTANNTSGAAPAAGTDTATIHNIGDLEAAYGDKLASYNANGLNIHDFVITQMAGCFDRANKIVAQEKTEPATGLGGMKIKLDQLQAELKTNTTNALNDGRRNVEKMLDALDPDNTHTMDDSACENAPSLYQQVTCVTAVKDRMNDIVNGRNGNVFTMNFKGNDARFPPISFACAGLNACAAKLSSVYHQVDEAQTQQTAFKKSYIARANQSVDQFVNQMGTSLGGASQMLTSQIQSLNTAIASVGGHGSININSVQRDELESDPVTDPPPGYPGLYKSPKNLVNVIGGRMQPPLPDLLSNNMGDAVAGLADARKDISDQMTRFASFRSTVMGLGTQCKALDVRTDLEAMNDLASRLDTIGCARPDLDPSVGGGKDPLQATLDAISGQAAVIRSMGGDSIDSLITGMQGAELRSIGDPPEPPSGCTPGDPKLSDYCRSELSKYARDLQSYKTKTQNAIIQCASISNKIGDKFRVLQSDLGPAPSASTFDNRQPASK